MTLRLQHVTSCQLLSQRKMSTKKSARTTSKASASTVTSASGSTNLSRARDYLHHLRDATRETGSSSRAMNGTLVPEPLSHSRSPLKMSAADGWATGDPAKEPLQARAHFNISNYIMLDLQVKIEMVNMRRITGGPVRRRPQRPIPTRSFLDDPYDPNRGVNNQVIIDTVEAYYVAHRYCEFIGLRKQSIISF